MELATDIPENHGLSSKSLLRFFERMEELQLEVNSFILLQDGKATAQFWRSPYRRDTPQLLYSMSKTFTSIAVGIAWDKGLLDLEDQVISFFPEQLPTTISANLAKMTVHHLLAMNAGHSNNIYGDVVKEQDWVKAFLALEVEHEPGSHYRYSTPCSYMLAAIVEKVSRQSLVDFMLPTLFEPLGIPRPSWETCPMGITAGGMGLSVSTEGVAKFGYMLMNQGVYEGNRIVSEAFLKLATTEQSDNRAGATLIDSAQGYGYQIHLCRRGCYRGGGSFGQLCFVAPEHKIVIAATCSFPNMNPSQTMLDLIYGHIFDHLEHDKFPPSPQEASDLQKQLARFAYSPVLLPVPGHLPFSNHSRYNMTENPHGLQQVGFKMNERQLQLELLYGDERDNKLPFDFTMPMQARDVFNKDLSMHLQEVVTYAAWLDSGTLQLTLFYIETPYRVTYSIGFQDNVIEFEFHINVSLSIPKYKTSGLLQM